MSETIRPETDLEIALRTVETDLAAGLLQPGDDRAVLAEAVKNSARMVVYAEQLEAKYKMLRDAAHIYCDEVVNRHRSIRTIDQVNDLFRRLHELALHPWGS